MICLLINLQSILSNVVDNSSKLKRIYKYDYDFSYAYRKNLRYQKYYRDSQNNLFQHYTVDNIEQLEQYEEYILNRIKVIGQSEKLFSIN